MQDTGTDMNILIISNDRHQSGLLRQAIEQRGVRCAMRRIEPTLAAAGVIRRLESASDASAPDMVFFDLAKPDPDKLLALKRIAFGKRRTTSPVVILTSDLSEHLLKDAGVADGRSIMFEPAELSCFLKKMREHKSARFKRALSVMYELGPVLVRLPRSFVDSPETLLA